MIPFNIKIAEVTNSSVKSLRPVTSLDMYVSSSKDFHPDGLFSQTSFGMVGTDMRDDKFAYIDIKTSILHPIIYDRLIRIKGLYKSILNGTAYAVWDDKLKDFVSSDESEGDTGFSFFASKWEHIEFRKNDSLQRTKRIDVIEKYRTIAFQPKVLVLPAGMRDAEIDTDGRVVQDEVNKLYRKLISISNTISGGEADHNSPMLDQTRFSLQLTFNEIYATFKAILEGKHGFLQQKWASRKLFYGTRNVITTMEVSPSYFGGANMPSVNNTVIGLFQTMKALEPVAVYSIKTMVADTFQLEQSLGNLINAKTKKREWVGLKQKVIDKWTTTEGIGKLINGFKDPKLRHNYVTIQGYHLALIYLDNKKNFKIIKDIDDVPPNIDRKLIRPITYAELFYLSNYSGWYKYPLMNTRFPIATDGSTYPSLIYTKTTVESEMRWELGDDWERIGDDHIAREMPLIHIPDFLDTQVPHPTRLTDLGADYDGDTMSGNGLMLNESIASVTRRMGSRDFYVRSSGSLRTSIKILTVEFVLFNTTGDYDEE